MKAKLLRWLAEWLFRNHRFLLEEIVVGHDKHIHRNPKSARRIAVEEIISAMKEVSDV